MKNFRNGLIFTILSVSNIFIAQTINSNHPTINLVKVSYKAVSQATVQVNLNSSPQISTIPQGTITLKPNVSISEINFKIINKQNNSIIYQINYPINSPTITNVAGKKLFENINGVVFISSGQEVPLMPYEYQIITKDNLQVSSPIYIITQ